MKKLLIIILLVTTFINLPSLRHHVLGNSVETVDSIIKKQQDLQNKEYILVNSSDRYLNDDEISNLSSEILKFARNEIYARHGYIFKNAEYKNYFLSKPWYKENKNFNEKNDLNKFEIYNISIIKKYEDKITKPNIDYLLPQSDKEFLTSKNIENFSLELLQFGRNEIFARHGYVFTLKKYQDYFNQKPWYKKDLNFKGTNEELNKFEKNNVELIKKYENLHKLPEISLTYLIDGSNSRYLTEKDVMNLTLEMLQLARNEIYARHGYNFQIKKYKDYFESKSWYKKNAKFSENDLNDYEIKNIKLIEKYEALFKK